MKKRFTLLLLLIFSSIVLTAKEIRVSDYGAKPNDSKDDTRALREAVDHCCKNPSTTLIIEPGTYILHDKDAVILENKVLAGKMSENPEKVIFTPYYPYSQGLDFSGARDITVIAHGATLMCEGWMEPISIRDAQNITIKGLTIDYKRKPFSSGKVVSITDEYFEVQFSQERVIT